jgi:serine/threonine protein phosphatase PrpC
MSAFTGALQQKNSYNGQDHQRCGGKVWALVNDGHGVEKGKMAADFCALTMEADITAAIESGTLREFVAALPSYGPTLHERFRQKLFMNADIFADENGVPKSSYARDFVRGGTTSTVVFHLESDDDKKQEEKVVFGWVGDSSGKIFLESEDGKVTILDGTEDHGGSNRAEYARLEARRQTGAVTGHLCYDTGGADHDSQYLRIYDADGSLPFYTPKAIVATFAREDHQAAVAELAKAPENEELATKVQTCLERATAAQETFLTSPQKVAYDKLVAYHAKNAELQKNPASAELKAQVEANLVAWREANQAYKAAPEYAAQSRINKGTTKDDGYGGYLVGPDSNKYGKQVRLAVTRSFGDFAGHQVGLIPEMEVREFLVKDLAPARRRVIFVASDGVHDCYTDEDLAKLVLSGKSNDQLLAEFIVKSAQLFGKQSDDISFVRKEF